MKREFKPEMTVVRFGAEDVIATSSLSVRGFDAGSNHIAGDGQITFKGITYTVGSQSSDFYSALTSAGYNGAGTHIGKQGENGKTYEISTIVDGENDPAHVYKTSWDGFFVWSAGSNAFIKQ